MYCASLSTALSHTEPSTLAEPAYTGNNKDFFPLGCSPSPLGCMGELQPIPPSGGPSRSTLKADRDCAASKGNQGSLLLSETISSLAKRS